MEVRKRKNQASTSPSPYAGGSGDNAQKTKSEKLDRGFTAVILPAVLAFLAAFALAALFPDLLPDAARDGLNAGLSAVGLKLAAHAVVIDAGSTGSRVLAFSFERELIGGGMKLVDELWHEVKPGLSSYADNPAEGAKSIEVLLEKARDKIPEAARKATPITLKATAGLRLLPQDKAQALLDAVESTLRTSGFAPEEDLLGIMDPMEEGLFGWFTVNFLTKRLRNAKERSYVALDLGGGSTQITFAPNKTVGGVAGRKDFLHNVTIMGDNTEIYSHSYLGLGLMAAREAIFKHGNAPDATELRSPCVCHHEHDPVPWTHKGKDYKLLRKDSSFAECAKVVNKILNANNVHMPTEIAKREVVAFSYFFDRASERKLIPKGFEGRVPITTIIYEAQRACDPYSNSQFYCADLAYISLLLTKGYGLPPEKELYIAKKIDGKETSWALGLAYSILNR